MYHKDEKKKTNKILTVLLLFVLLLVVFINISIFVSGPKYHYDDKINQEMNVIYQKYDKLDSPLTRHVFQYITYSTKMEQTYCWFNQKGEMIAQRDINTYQINQVEAKIQQYKMDQYTITLGYGYDGPVYVITNDEVDLLLILVTIVLMLEIDVIMEVKLASNVSISAVILES